MSDFPMAPDFAPGLVWVNGQGARISQLRGRITALVFWHAGSAMSANLLVELGYLQAKYGDGLTVLGIHTPKFDAQRDPGLVARAVNRLGVRFAVASDSDAVTWQHYGIRAWPSVALVDAEGRFVEIVAGDQQRDLLEQKIATLLDEAGERGLRVYANAPTCLRPEPMRELAFPNALALSPQHLYVSDSGHHRILECSHEGKILRVFGSGTAGFVDGSGVQAGFHSPCGLVLVKDGLYVADTGNHAIRRIQLSTGNVDTVMGQGSAGTPLAVENYREQEVFLDRPVGLASAHDKLYVSLAAANQVWELDLANFGFRHLAGSGRLALADGTASLAAFAQPSGMAIVQQTLVVADAQASSLRGISLASDAVHTLVGAGLFEFGMVDGKPPQARLQFPQGIAADARAAAVWVADCYNNAIALFRLTDGELSRLPIAYPLCRPTAVVGDGALLWIANTDAHEVLRVDLATNEVFPLPMTL